MVTGTTARSGDQSIITAWTGTPVAASVSFAKYSVCPGSAKPLRYSTVLATGLVTTAKARCASTSATAARIDAIAAGPLVASGRPGAAVTGRPRSTTGKARANTDAASAGLTAAIGTASCRRWARPARKSVSATT